MTDEEIPKSMADTFFKHIRTHANNNNCFDCNKTSPIWASTTYGVFICTDCASKHREMGVNISKVKSTLLDKWSLDELRRMYVSGNAIASVLGSSADIRHKYTNGKKYARELDGLVKQNEVDNPGDSFIRNLGESRKLEVKPSKVEVRSMPKFSDRALDEKPKAPLERSPEPKRKEAFEKPVKVPISPEKFASLKKSDTKLKNINVPSGRLGFGALNVSDSEKSDE